MHPHVLRSVSHHVTGFSSTPLVDHSNVPLLTEPLIEDHCRPGWLLQTRRLLDDVAAVRRHLILSPVWLLVALSVLEAAIVAQGAPHVLRCVCLYWLQQS